MKAMWQRVAVRQGKLFARQGQVFVQHVVPAVIKPARTLWNDFIAFLFFCLAAMFGFRTARLWMDLGHGAAGSGAREIYAALGCAFCTLLMIWFGFSSYRRARKISRS